LAEWIKKPTSCTYIGKETHEDEVPANYKDREKQSDLDSRKPRAPGGNDPRLERMVIVNGQKETSKATSKKCMGIKELEASDYEITEAGQETSSQICNSMPKNITLKDRLLEVYSPSEPRDQVPKITMQKYWLIGVHVTWEPRDQYIALKLWTLGTYFPWDPRGQEWCTKL
jgi:hypothetical protein